MPEDKAMPLPVSLSVDVLVVGVGDSADAVFLSSPTQCSAGRPFIHRPAATLHRRPGLLNVAAVSQTTPPSGEVATHWDAAVTNESLRTPLTWSSITNTAPAAGLKKHRYVISSRGGKTASVGEKPSKCK